MATASSDLEAILSEVSIRGRMAYSVACIRAFATNRLVHSASLDRCLAVLSEFCAADDLGWWERTALDRIWPVLESRAIVQESGLEVLHEVVDWAFDDVGRGNLHAGVVGRSETTLSAALRIATAMSVGVGELPDARPFLSSPFKSVHGWGEPFNAIS